MKYVIYKLEQPEHLQSREDDYFLCKEVTRNVLTKIDNPDVQEKWDTFEDAIAEINRCSEYFKNMTLTVLPVFNI